MSITVYYFHLALDNEIYYKRDKSESGVVVAKILGFLTLASLPYFIMTEVKQFRVEKNKMEYIKSGWNWVDSMSLLLTLIITLFTLFDVDLIPA